MGVKVQGLGFGVSGLWFRAWSLGVEGFGVWVVESRVHSLGLGLKVEGSPAGTTQLAPRTGSCTLPRPAEPLQHLGALPTFFFFSFITL